MRVLVVGSGGREHALVWKLAQSDSIENIFVAPGNPMIALESKTTCTSIAAENFISIIDLCRRERIGFVVVGPDQALADGLVDKLESEGIPAFGPVKEAARLEYSKAFSKEIMKNIGIPTAKFEVFEDFTAAKKFLCAVEWGDGWVIKADGLALGKGVVVCESKEEALKVAEDFLEKSSMGSAGKKIVIEERLMGREVSHFSICDGVRAVTLGMACDYKRILDGDKGANTGGMGAFSPADWVANDLNHRVHVEIISPLLQEMNRRGIAYKGILFSGLMITKEGPKVIEFNARFGDPETQVLLPLIDEDILPWLMASRNGSLGQLSESGPRLKKMSAVHVVMAAAGYPGANGQVVRKGDVIHLPQEFLPTESEKNRFVKVFFAGVSRDQSKQQLITNGGRVLGLTALAATRADARKRAYDLIDLIRFEGAQRRSDVGL